MYLILYMIGIFVSVKINNPGHWARTLKDPYDLTTTSVEVCVIQFATIVQCGSGRLLFNVEDDTAVKIIK